MNRRLRHRAAPRGVAVFAAALVAALALLAPAAAARAATRPPQTRTAAGPRRAAHPTAVTRPRVPADTRAGARVRGTPRTLDDIHIDGEIPVPQVLFVTARDQRRFMEFQNHRYQRTSLELGRATPTPARVVVPAPAPAERKEIQR